MSRYRPVELLAAKHDFSAFDCGSAEQTSWLQRHALSAQQADTARVYVVCRTSDERVVAYYSLVAGGVQPHDASARLRAGTGRYPIPVVILARLGVDVQEQGRGLGAALLRDALLQTAAVATKVGVRALLVHAESDAAARFYRHFDPAFEPSPTDPLHLILLMKNIRGAIRQAANNPAIRRA